MRFWGEDNFANEGARDYLEMLAAKLVATASEIFIDAERLELDEDGESMFMPSVELLAMLCERYNVAPPKLSLLRQWQEKYLKVYDASSARCHPDPRFRTERRKVIEKTFRWLMSLSESYWDN